MIGASLVSLLMIPAADSAAQSLGPASGEYARAIRGAIQPRWELDSYNSELEPSSSCALRILQMPGGDVLSVDVLPDCDFNEAGRAGLVDAVRRSAPLPYHGFESVFQREIRIVFRAASASDRLAQAAVRAETEQVRKNAAESDRQWEAVVGSRRRHDEYTKRCSFHLLWEMHKVQLQRKTAVIVTIDKSGKVIGVAGDRKEPMDERLVAALSAAPPCEPVPADLAVGAGTIEVGPIVVGNHSD